jgi:hypothetical protein
MRAFYSRLPAALAIAPWAYFLWSGYDLCYGRGAMPPNSGQVHLYVVAPAIGTTVAVVLLALAHKTPRWLGWGFFVVQILALVVIILPWGGGI